MLTAEKQMAILKALSKEEVSEELMDTIIGIMDYVHVLQNAIKDHKRAINSMIATQDENDRYLKTAFDKIGF